MSEDHVALLSSSIEKLLSPIPGVIEKSPAGNKVLNISSIVELLNQTGSLEKFLEVHQSLNSNSMEELLAPKADRSQRESFLPLTSNSTDELLHPKTVTPIEGRLQPLNSNSISLAKLLKTRAYASSDHRDASIVSRVVVSTEPA